MPSTITNITQVSATYTMPIWPTGTVGIVKDNKGTAATNGDLIFFGTTQATNNTIMYACPEGGSPAAVGADFAGAGGPVVAACQSSDGVVHTLTASETFGTLLYSKFTLTRDGSGHVTGRTVSVSNGALPGAMGSHSIGIESRADITPVVINGVEKIAVAALFDNGNSSTNYIAYAAVSTNNAPTSAATSWNTTTGTNNAVTTIGSSSSIGSYYKHIRVLQNPSSGDLYFFWGQAPTGDSDTGTASNPLQYASMTASGSWWGALSGWSTIGDHESNAPASFMCVYALSDSILVFWHRPSTGLRIDKVDAAGALTQNFLPAPSWTAGTNNTSSMVQGICAASSDGSRFWALVHTYSPSQDLRWLEYNSGWTVTQDPRQASYVNGTDYPALLGSVGWNGGVAALHSTRQGVYTSPTEYGLLIGSTAQLGMSTVVSGSFTPVVDGQVLIGGVWKQIVDIDVLAGGVWQNLVP